MIWKAIGGPEESLLHRTPFSTGLFVSTAQVRLGAIDLDTHVQSEVKASESLSPLTSPVDFTDLH